MVTRDRDLQAQCRSFNQAQGIAPHDSLAAIA
jgi:hypothetical protein